MPVGRIFAGTWLAYAAYYLCRKNFSVLMPSLATHLALTKDRLATLVFAYSVAYAAGQFLSGTLADRFGAKRIVLLGMITSAVCNLGLAASGISPGGQALFLLFAGLQIGNGFGQSAGWPGLLKITANWFDSRNRAVLMAWWSTNYVIGGMAATLLTTWFITGAPAFWLPSWGWRLGAAGPALLLILVGVVFAVLVEEGPRRVQEPLAEPAGAWKEVIDSPALRSIALCYFCLKLMRYTFLFWLPLYMVEKLRYSEAEAGYSSSLYELAGFIGVPLAGYLSDHVMASRRFPVGCLMMFGLALACLVFPELSALSRVGNLIGIGLVGALTFGPDSLLAGAATQDAATPRTAATAGGFVNGVGSAGQLVSPFLVSLAVRFGGWDALFHVFFGIAVAGGLILAGRWSSERAAVGGIQYIQS